MSSHRVRRPAFTGPALPSLLAVLVFVAGCAAPPRAPSGATLPAESGPPAPADVERRAQVRIELATAYFARGQYDTALEEVRQAIAARPDFADAYNLRGLIYASLGEPRQAEDSFQRALQLNPRDGDAMHNYGWFLCQQRRFADAQVQFDRALQLPQYRAQPRTLLAQGVCRARNGEWAEAERAMLRAYELDPSSPATAVNLSEVLYRRGEYERARFYVRRVNNQADQASAQTLWLALRIERKLGNQRGVQDLGRDLRARFPQSPEALALERGQFDE